MALTSRETVKAILQGAIWDLQDYSEETADYLITKFLGAITDEQADNLATLPRDIILMVATFYFFGRADAMRDATNELRKKMP